MQLRGGPVLGENGRAVGIHEPVECGPTADLAAYDVDMTVTRRPATAADLARLEPPPSARPVRPGHAMHLMRQSTNPRSWRNYRSVMGADAPAIEEEPVTPVTSTPPAIPCGTCLHEPVCALKASIPDLGTHVQLDPRKLADGLWLIVTGYAVDCDHHLPVIALRETTADRMAPPRIVPVASVEEPSAKLSNSAHFIWEAVVSGIATLK